MGGGGAFGQKPPPRCCYSPRFGSKATSGILPAKAAAGFGILPPKAGLFNPGKRARAEPGSPPPPPGSRSRPSHCPPGRPDPVGAGGWRLRSSRWGRERVRSRSFAAVPLSPGRKKKKKARGKGNGQITPKGQAGMGPRARGAKGGSVLSPVHGGKLPVGRWAMRPEEGWRRASGGNATALVLLFFKRLSIVQHVVPTRPRC